MSESCAPFLEQNIFIDFVCFGCWLSLFCALANLANLASNFIRITWSLHIMYNVQAFRIPLFGIKNIYWLLFVFVASPVCSCLPLSERVATGKHYTYFLTSSSDWCVCSFPCKLLCSLGNDQVPLQNRNMFLSNFKKLVIVSFEAACQPYIRPYILSDYIRIICPTQMVIWQWKLPSYFENQEYFCKEIARVRFEAATT